MLKRHALNAEFLVHSVTSLDHSDYQRGLMNSS